jgi:F-type H+-transporting ATPase subunit a
MVLTSVLTALSLISLGNHHVDQSSHEVGEANANEGKVEHSLEHDGQSEKEFKAVDMIMHHISDAHDFHILGEGHNSVSLPLPIILYTEKGLVAFLSSEFKHDDHGKEVVDKKGLRFVKAHEHIYFASEKANHHGAFLTEIDGEIVNQAPLDFSITKNVFFDDGFCLDSICDLFLCGSEI